MLNSIECTNTLICSCTRQIGTQFAEHITIEQYPEALGMAQTSLQTLKQLPNHSLFTAGAEIIESEIQKELKRKLDG